MLSPAIVKSCCLLAVMVLMTSGSALGREASRIELDDGSVYEDATFSVDNAYKIVVIRVGDWKRNVAFTDVKLILDPAGTDITQDVLEEYYRTPDEPVKQKSSWATGETGGGRRLLPWTISFRLGTNFSVPAGEYYEGINAGVGGYGIDLTVPVSKQLALRGLASKSGMRLDREEFSRVVEFLLGVEVLDNDVGVRTWRYMFCVEYYKWPRRARGGNFWWFLYSGLGYVNTTFDGQMMVRDLNDDHFLLSYDYSEGKFSLTNGGGVVHMLSSVVGMELGASFDLVFVSSEDSAYDSYTSAFIFDFKLGLVFLAK